MWPGVLDGLKAVGGNAFLSVILFPVRLTGSSQPASRPVIEISPPCRQGCLLSSSVMLGFLGSVVCGEHVQRQQSPMFCHSVGATVQKMETKA